MSTRTTQPGKGGVVKPPNLPGRPAHVPTGPFDTDEFGEFHAVRFGITRDGTWRPNVRFHHAAGVKIELRRERGLTSGRVLRVPMRMQAPVTGDLTRDHQHPWSTWDTVGHGQRSRPQGPQLLELPISTVLLDPEAQHNASGGVVAWSHAPHPQRWLMELRHIAGLMPGSRATVFRLTLTQPAVWDHALVNMLATLTRVSATQKDSIGTEYVDLTFLQYRPLHADRRRRPRGSEKTRHHKLHHGDTLYELAKHYYHRPSAWRLIADANGIKGVRPHSSDDLAKWAKRHHKTQLRIPPAPTPEAHGRGPGVELQPRGSGPGVSD